MKHKAMSYIFTAVVTVVFLSACVTASPQANQPTPTQPELSAPTAQVPKPTEEMVTPTVAPEPTQIPLSDEFRPAVAYIGVDGNVWLSDFMGKEKVQLTDDAAGYSDTWDHPVVVFQNPKWSTDGLLLAFERQDGEPMASGYNFTYSLWVYDITTKDAKSIYQGEITTFDWKPGAHQVAFSQAVDPGYFGRSGDVADLAKGISLLDVESVEVTELVKPERGYHLGVPVWSPDARFISFQEFSQPEGSGMFAYYDLAAQEYVSWDEPVGSYSWSDDGETILYDTMTYIAQGNEAIYTRPRAGGEAVRFSPQLENGYAYSPVYSERGELVAYLADFDGPDNHTSTLFYLETAKGEPHSLGEFQDAGFLSWTPGWAHILMTRGPWDNAEILLVSPSLGTVQVLARGSQPQWNPALPLQ